MGHPFTPPPVWTYDLAWSVVIVVTAYFIGSVAAQTVCRRLSAVAARTKWGWDALVVDALQRGLPWWSVLVGCSIAVGLWSLDEPVLTLLNRSLYLLFWLSVTWVTAVLAGRLILLYGAQFQHAMPVTSLTQNITRIIIVILGILMILNGLGISITPLLTALGIGGLAVALALQDTLSNLFSGFYLTMARQVRIGDYVKLDSGHEGYVEDIGWRATKIRQLPNNMVLVPNNKLSQATIVNYYLPSRELAVLVDVGVDYQSDLAHVERVTCEVAREVQRAVAGGIPDFEPLIRYHTLSDFSINFTVVLRAREFVDQYLLKHEFIKRLVPRYRQEGIMIPFPARTVLTKHGE